MKKKHVKREVKKAFERMYQNGFTNTANAIMQDIFKRLNKIYSK